MGTSTDSTHVRSTVPGDTQAQQHRATFEENLSASAFIERRMTTIEAEAAAKVGHTAHRTQTPHDPLIMETLHVCNAQLREMLIPGWLSRSSIRIKINESLLDTLTSSQTEDTEMVRADLQRLCDGFSQSMKQDEIRKTALIIVFASKSPCIKPYIKPILTLLEKLDIALNSNAPDAPSKAEQILKAGRRVIAPMADSITTTLEASSPEALEAKRLSRIQTAAEKQKEVYRNSDEYRALKLLALVDERLSGGHGNLQSETRLAQRLSSTGFNGVERILLDCAPSLRIEVSHLQALRAIFDEVASSRNSIDTAHSGTQTLDADERCTTANSHSSANQTVTPEALEAKEDQGHLSSEQSPDAIAFKQLLLEDLGITDLYAQDYLSKAMTVQGIENASETLARAPKHVMETILKCNPRLLDPASGINLGMFCQDLNEFIQQAYDLQGIEEFNPLTSPANFRDHAALRQTRKSAAAFRIARQRSEGGEGTHG